MPVGMPQLVEVKSLWLAKILIALQAVGTRAGPALIDPVAKLTIDAWPWLYEPNADNRNQDVSGTGYKTYVTVPVEERWFVSFLWREATTAARNLAASIQGQTIYFDAASTTANGVYVGLWLNAGDSYGSTGTGNAGDTVKAVTAAYIKYRLGSWRTMP